MTVILILNMIRIGNSVTRHGQTYLVPLYHLISLVIFYGPRQVQLSHMFSKTGKGVGWVTMMPTDNETEPRFQPSTGTYIVDDEKPVSFTFSAVVPPNNPLNQVLFQTLELKPGNHTLKVTYIGNGDSTFQSGKSNSSLQPVDLSLQYLLVTNAPVPTSTPNQTSQSRPKPTGLEAQSDGANKLETPTIGGIIGGAVFLCLLLGIGFALWRRRVRGRYQMDLASEDDLTANMYNDTPHRVEPFPVTSAMREASRLDKSDQMVGKVLAQELSASQTDQSESSNNAASSSNTRNISPAPSDDLRSGPANDALHLVRHRDSGIRLHRDVVEVPPEYTER
jgi:hypothetical protein